MFFATIKIDEEYSSHSCSFYHDGIGGGGVHGFFGPFYTTHFDVCLFHQNFICAYQHYYCFFS
jgi:hypothetical protein